MAKSAVAEIVSNSLDSLANSPPFLSLSPLSQFPRARQEHKCCECGGIIQVGRCYHRHTGVWDHKAATYKVCVACDGLRNRMDSGADAYEQTGFGDLFDSIFNGSQYPPFMRAYAGICKAKGVALPEWCHSLIHDAEVKQEKEESNGHNSIGQGKSESCTGSCEVSQEF